MKLKPTTGVAVKVSEALGFSSAISRYIMSITKWVGAIYQYLAVAFLASDVLSFHMMSLFLPVFSISRHNSQVFWYFLFLVHLKWDKTKI